MTPEGQPPRSPAPLPCPFCGTTAIDYNPHKDWVSCGDSECAGYAMCAKLIEWNRRPRTQWDWLPEDDDDAPNAGAVMREEFTTIGERYDALEMVELRLVSGYADQSGDVQTGYGTALRHLRDFMRRLAPLRFDRDHDVNGHLRAFVGGLGGGIGLVETPSRTNPVIAATEDHPAVYRDGKRLTATPPNVIRKPTIEELEAILADKGQRNVELLPDGSVVVRRAGPTREQVEALRQWFMPDDELAIAYLDRDSVLALFASSTPGTGERK